MYDLIIRNGMVVDGVCTPAYPADVCIKKGKIEKIASNVAEKGKEEIDAKGKIVSPGFIDVHCHSDLAPLANFQPESMVYQGVTFELCGNCGISILPSTPATRKETAEYFIKNLQFNADGINIDNVHTMDDYVKAAKKNTESINYGLLIGHGLLRGAVMGFDNRKPTKDEVNKMKERLDQELSMGAFGMSLGLIYPPSAFAEVEEIEELARVVKKHDGILAVHIRNEGPRVFESVKEMLDIAEHSGVHLEISHLKIMTKSLWGQSQKLLDMIDEARIRGINVTCDQYPFYASSTSLTACVPKWAHSGGISAMMERICNPEQKLLDDIAAEVESRGGAECILIASTHDYMPKIEGKRVNEIAKEFGMSEVDTIVKILKDCKCAVNANYFSQNEGDMLRIISRRDIMVGSDGYNFSYDQNITAGTPHPRSFCTFPHALELMRDHKLMSLEEAVHKMTGLTAKVLGMNDRGEIAVGKVADITIFDAKKVGQNGDFMHPFSKPLGIETVIVSGEVILKNGEIQKAHPGAVLRHGKC